MKIRRWIAELFGLQDAYSRVMVQNQEREIAEMKREINGLKMESDILYAKSIKK